MSASTCLPSSPLPRYYFIWGLGMYTQSAGFQGLCCTTKTPKKVSDYVPFNSAVQRLTFVHSPVGTRHNATINSNRWASRTPSQRRHQKNWVPPELCEQRSVPDKIVQYSKDDYVVGESSPGMLQRIANQFNNSPNAAQQSSDSEIQEIDSIPRYPVAELDADSWVRELVG